MTTAQIYNICGKADQLIMWSKGITKHKKEKSMAGHVRFNPFLKAFRYVDPRLWANGWGFRQNLRTEDVKMNQADISLEM